MCSSSTISDFLEGLVGIRTKLGGLGAMNEPEQSCGPAGVRRSCSQLAWNGLLSRERAYLNRNPSRRRGVRFFQSHDALVRNLPTEIFRLAALFVMLFEKDGAAGIADKRARRGKANISGAVLHFNRMTQKGGITSHASSLLTESSIVNSTNGLIQEICG